MTVSVRMAPLLENQMEQAAKRKGITKSQFIIEAVERSLGYKNPFELMTALVAEEDQKAYGPLASPADRVVAQSYEAYEQPYETDRSRQQLLTKLKAKHSVRSDR